MRKTALLLFAALPGLAGEYAVLHNGFRVYAERHERAGELVRLHTSSGTLEFPAADIARYEQEDYIPPAPPAQAVEMRPAEAVITPQQLVAEAAVRHGLKPEFVKSVASVESAFRTDAVSPKGATGLMQLMPATAAELGADPKDPAQNAEAGARYLRQLLDKYKGHPDGVRLALAAYNAGPGAVDRYRNIPPYRETQAYVHKVVKKYLTELEKQSPPKPQAD